MLTSKRPVINAEEQLIEIEKEILAAIEIGKDSVKVCNLHKDNRKILENLGYTIGNMWQDATTYQWCNSIMF